MTGPTITIAGRAIGAEHPPFVIAEMSANHNGDLDRAFEIMAAAKDAVAGNLDQSIGTFRRAAEAAGASVVEVATAEQA
ncbi:MAG: hypothetical protein QF767_00370, partial [Alphaproteobacteria bacterium]|nr:hypothetical protein [Alphaproteobacteria bacterium]